MTPALGLGLRQRQPPRRPLGAQAMHQPHMPSRSVGLLQRSGCGAELLAGHYVWMHMSRPSGRLPGVTQPLPTPNMCLPHQALCMLRQLCTTSATVAVTGTIRMLHCWQQTHCQFRFKVKVAAL